MKHLRPFLFVCGMCLSLQGVAVLAQDSEVNLKSVVLEGSRSEVAMTEDGIARIGWVRDDVPVTVDGMRLDPPAGLGSWAAFTPVDGGAMVMGDTVVFEDEITPAMDAAIANGLAITALHNHFIFDDPPVYFMHIGGQGDPAQLAAGVKAVWDAIKTVRGETPLPRRSFGRATPDADGIIEAASLTGILGAEPSINEGVVKFTFGRQGRMHGVEIDGSMGLSTWAAFSGTDELAAVNGDFIMSEDEVQAVIRALRAHDINVVALHNHMIGGEPAFYFLHYWGVGPAVELADGVQAARDAQAAVAHSSG